MKKYEKRKKKKQESKKKREKQSKETLWFGLKARLDKVLSIMQERQSSEEAVVDDEKKAR